MNNEIKGMCLFLGFLGLTYVALLLLLVLFTSVKIAKSIVFISLFSSALITFGLSTQVKTRITNRIQSLFSKN